MRVRSNPSGLETGGYPNLIKGCSNHVLEKVFSAL